MSNFKISSFKAFLYICLKTPGFLNIAFIFPFQKPRKWNIYILYLFLLKKIKNLSKECLSRIFLHIYRMVLVLLLFSGWIMSDSFATPWTIAHQAHLFMAFPREEYWSGLPFPLPGVLPHPGTEPTSPALAGGFLTVEPSGKPKPDNLLSVKYTQKLVL